MNKKVEELKEKALRNAKVADHMVYVTYKLFNDPKILLAIIENIFLALSSGMNAVLIYERNKKNIPAYPENFDAKLNIFRERCADNYSIEKNHIALIGTVKEIIQAHKESPVEFVRKDKFVICSDNYRMRTLSIEQIKEYVNWTKSFVNKINEEVTDDK